MPIIWQCEDVQLSAVQAELLWRNVMDATEYPDEEVAVRCLSIAEIKALNNEYRGKQKPTNVLTFSYDVEHGEPSGSRTHDIVLCADVIREESELRAVGLVDYTALVVVHALLHVVGMDHEKSEEQARKTQQLEQQILAKSGFAPLEL